MNPTNDNFLSAANRYFAPNFGGGAPARIKLRVTIFDHHDRMQITDFAKRKRVIAFTVSQQSERLFLVVCADVPEQIEAHSDWLCMSVGEREAPANDVRFKRPIFRLNCKLLDQRALSAKIAGSKSGNKWRMEIGVR